MAAKKVSAKKEKAIRFFEDEMSGRVYDWTPGSKGSGNTDSASVSYRRLYENNTKKTATKKNTRKY